MIQGKCTGNDNVEHRIGPIPRRVTGNINIPSDNPRGGEE